MDSNSAIMIPMFSLFLLIMASLYSSSSSFPISKPGCEDRCGTVSIPFPFGIKEGCYLNEEFFVNCTNFVPLSGNIQVINISLEGQLRYLHYMGYNCYNPINFTTDKYYDTYTLLSDAFTFNSTVNKLTTIGCDTYSVVRGKINYNSVYTVGCISVCDHKNDVLSGSCKGIGCCQTSIPDGAWQINVTVETFNNHSDVWDFNPCSYAFVVEDSKFQFVSENLTNIDKNAPIPVVVDWVIEYNVKCEKAKMNLSSYACLAENSECVDQPGAVGYRCKCRDGFEGNPYLPSNGCQDINECASPKFYNCVNHSTCYNTWGSYKCDCDQGYHFNGKSGINKECSANASHKKIYLAISAVAGSCAIVVVLSYFWYSRLMKMKEHNLREEYFRKNGGFLLQEKLSVSQWENRSHAVRIFTYAELQDATNNFDDSQIIGQGSFGTVYRGDLIDEIIVAIKKSRGVDYHGVEEFIDEVICLSRINNRNVVKLFGCCLETEIPLLVYEFINNGTLFEHLKDIIRNRGSNLSWNIRMRIASQIAEVLYYLHSCISPPIIHRDIKSSNILLDQDYTAKIADFGISRMVENQLSSMEQWTLGYLDPEYLQTGILTEKSDVYSFGVVLIEILTGKKVYSTTRPEAERFLANHFLRHLNDENLVGVLEHNYNIENFELIKEVAMIAKRCISVKGEDRPYMKEVSKELIVLEKKGRNVSRALDIASKECNVLVHKQQPKASSSSDGHPSTYSFGDLYPLTTTTLKENVTI